MRFNEFVLVGVTDDLKEEPKARQIADAIEFRMGSAKNPIKQLSEYSGELPLIATSRPEPEETNSQNRLDGLFQAANIRQVEAVDVELSTVLETNQIRNTLDGLNTKVIVSYHNFNKTPNKSKIDRIVDEAANNADIVRIDVFAEKVEDILVLLSCINEKSDAGMKISGTSLGEIGKHSRPIAPQYGSKIGYAPISKNSLDSELGELELGKLSKLIDNIDNNSTQMAESLRDRLQQLGVDNLH